MTCRRRRLITILGGYAILLRCEKERDSTNDRKTADIWVVKRGGY